MNAYCNLYLINSSFDNCSSIFSGAYLQLSGKLEIENSNFTDNRAEYNGGAIYISDVDASIRNSTFSNNHGESMKDIRPVEVQYLVISVI